MAVHKGRRVMTRGSKHAIATHQAKKSGFSNFKASSPGGTARSRIAEGIAKKNRIVAGPARRRRT